MNAQQQPLPADFLDADVRWICNTKGRCGLGFHVEGRAPVCLALTGESVDYLLKALSVFEAESAQVPPEGALASGVVMRAIPARFESVFAKAWGAALSAALAEEKEPIDSPFQIR